MKKFYENFKKRLSKKMNSTRNNVIKDFKENTRLMVTKTVVIAGITVASLAVVIGTNNMGNQKLTENVAVISTNSYQISYKGIELGKIENTADLESIKELAYNKVADKIGYEPDIYKNITVTDVSSKDLVESNELANMLSDAYYNSIEEFKIPVYVLNIEGKTSVALNTKEDLQKVLEQVESNVVGANVSVNIEEKGNKIQVKSVVADVPVLKETASNMMLATATMAVPELTSEKIAPQLSMSSVEDETQELPMVAIAEIEKEDKKEVSEREVVDIDFADEVKITKEYRNKDEIKIVSEAVAVLESTDKAKEIYVIEMGDSPYKIALENDMKLAELYSLNEGLEAKAKGIKVGDEVVINVPEPELNVSVKENITYDAPANYKTEYIDSDEVYVGRTEVTQDGVKGLKKVRATVSKVNEREVDRTILNETMIIQPINKIIANGTKPIPTLGASGVFAYPLKSYRITSPFGPRWGGFHTGVDLATPTGSKVRAADGGTVTISGWEGGYGYMVEIDHGNGFTTRYAHNSKLLVNVGDIVGQGDLIAKSGSTGNSTGPHVHFEVRYEDEPQNPMDYLD